jgi:DNA repair protein RadC
MIMLNEFGLRDASSISVGAGTSWPTDDQVRLLSRLLRPTQGTRRSRQLADQLMERFGSVPAVLAASPRRLMEVKGIGPATIRLLFATLETAQKLARERLGDNRPLLASSSQLEEYLRLMMAHLPIEQFRVLFLDKRNRLMADEVQQIGTVDHTPVYPREVIKRSLELGASALILAHNHPSGDPSPSSSDIRMTREIETVAKPLGITVHDHVVIGRFGLVSLRKLGVMGGLA